MENGKRKKEPAASRSGKWHAPDLHTSIEGIEINQENQFFTGFLEEIFKKVQENHANLFEYSESEGSLNIDFYETNSHFESDLRDAFKTVEINLSTKTIDFIVTKSV